jgi:hypothetical protein
MLPPVVQFLRLNMNRYALHLVELILKVKGKNYSKLLKNPMFTTVFLGDGLGRDMRIKIQDSMCRK